MRSFREKLAAEFPATPDSFRQCVERTVAKQMLDRHVTRTIGHGKRFSFSKTLIPVAACLILACGTVAAAGVPVFQRWLTGLGANGEKALHMVIQADGDPDAIQMDENKEQEALFTVREAYFDGATLMFWAVPEEPLTCLDFGDHVYINGTDNRLEYVAETEPGSGIYECRVTVMDAGLMNTPQDALDIAVEVYGPWDGKRQYSCRIASDKLRPADSVVDQVLELSYGCVEVRDLHVAPSSIKFTLHWTVYSEDILKLIYIPDYFVEDSSGNRGKSYEMGGTTGVNVETYDEADHCWTFIQEFEFKQFDSASEYMLFIPIEESNDEDGRETAREDMSFKIMLK